MESGFGRTWPNPALAAKKSGVAVVVVVKILYMRKAGRRAKERRGGTNFGEDLKAVESEIIGGVRGGQAEEQPVHEHSILPLQGYSKSSHTANKVGGGARAGERESGIERD